MSFYPTFTSAFIALSPWAACALMLKGWQAIPRKFAPVKIPRHMVLHACAYSSALQKLFCVTNMHALGRCGHWVCGANKAIVVCPLCPFLVFIALTFLTIVTMIACVSDFVGGSHRHPWMNKRKRWIGCHLDIWIQSGWEDAMNIKNCHGSTTVAFVCTICTRCWLPKHVFNWDSKFGIGSVQNVKMNLWWQWTNLRYTYIHLFYWYTTAKTGGSYHVNLIWITRVVPSSSHMHGICNYW